MQRTTSFWVIPGIFVCTFNLLFVDYVSAQSKKGRGRGFRKPGEVITRPDRSGERWVDQLEVGNIAPEFSLPLLWQDTSSRKTSRTQKSANKKTRQNVTLHDLRANQPVVLIFGSFTCPPFRNQLEGVDAVYEQFKDRAQFLFVYVREAHPDSVLSVIDQNGKESLRKIPQPTDMLTRVSNAAICQRTKDLNIPIAIDTIDNRVGKAYAGRPNRMVVVGTDGKFLFVTVPSPLGTDARSLRNWLSKNLTKSSS
ncbi:deiodinase-like protein [Gimesia aquarii]|uniref:Iodothyronine deiodinase n=1 Tax=Gimesia aquarii TaxID=2527964 RepID=A0A517W0F5_9PLAN|nr:deiodinase-like protein [Gimesia aquarii]QDT98734.1 Iodothyronine deiodinase [Gimesia aquarii]